jgi:hypothetical protein
MGQSGPHWTVQCALEVFDDQARWWLKRLLSGNCCGTVAKTLDCPVCQATNATHRATVNRMINVVHISSAMVARLHQIVRCATGLSGVPSNHRYAMVGTTIEGNKLMIVQCPVCTVSLMHPRIEGNPELPN